MSQYIIEGLLNIAHQAAATGIQKDVNTNKLKLAILGKNRDS